MPTLALVVTTPSTTKPNMNIANHHQPSVHAMHAREPDVRRRLGGATWWKFSARGGGDGDAAAAQGPARHAAHASAGRHQAGPSAQHVRRRRLQRERPRGHAVRLQQRLRMEDGSWNLL